MSAQIDRLGVAALQTFFAKNGWLFREQFTHDFGIDAHVEIVEDRVPTGKLIAIQIKSGSSYFSEETADSVVFRTDDKHVGYWINHSMPVIIAMYNPDSNTIIWQQATKRTAEKTGKNWKFLLPKDQNFSDPKRALRLLSELTQPESYIRRLNRLRLDKAWLQKISDGEEVTVEFEDWVNKSLSQYQITISCERESEIWPTIYAPGMTIDSMLSHLLPWATYRAEAVDGGYTQDGEILPISSNGETEKYILNLELNELGESFMVVDEFLDSPDDMEEKVFTLEKSTR